MNKKNRKPFFSYKMNIKHNSISSKGRRRRVKFVCFLVHTKTNSLSLTNTEREGERVRDKEIERERG